MGINSDRLPEMEGDKPKTKRFASYAIGYFHIDIAEVRTEEGQALSKEPDRFRLDPSHPIPGPYT